MFKVTVTREITNRVTMTKTRIFLVAAASPIEAQVLVSRSLSPEWLTASYHVDEVAPVMELRSAWSAQEPS